MSTEADKFDDLTTEEAESITGGTNWEVGVAVMLSEPEVVVEP
jgi:hypothetical protein